jgi:hypothetical protein
MMEPFNHSTPEPPHEFHDGTGVLRDAYFLEPLLLTTIYLVTPPLTIGHPHINHPNPLNSAPSIIPMEVVGNQCLSRISHSVDSG